jgi:signal transduction histidine kinase
MDWRSKEVNTEKFSINKECIVIFSLFLFLTVAMLCSLYFFTENTMAVYFTFVYSILIFILMVLLIVIVRKKILMFCEGLCTLLDTMMHGKKEITQEIEKEPLFYKVNHRLLKLYEVMIENRNNVIKEKKELQELISDISHQIKTPISNLKIVNATLIEQQVPTDEQKKFLKAMDTQIDKLDFLMQALIKTSRLETGIISLIKQQHSIYDTLASALGGIILSAERKQISIKVNCKENLMVCHDRKWTSEALFNILDNAVKYSSHGGEIYVAVDEWEMYLKIDITDNGKGILEKNQAEIFKRFYREDSVHNIEGIGIGLYLSRKIITLQGGYIKVASKLGKGATFSVFLPYN